jgi:hypothetical protein
MIAATPAGTWTSVPQQIVVTFNNGAGFSICPWILRAPRVSVPYGGKSVCMRAGGDVGATFPVLTENCLRARVRPHPRTKVLSFTF